MSEIAVKPGASRRPNKLFDGGVVLGDGAMGTMLHERGISLDRCSDELSLSQPEMVLAIHAEYVLAGAEIIETNTFGANACRLERHGLPHQVREINLAGVRLARQAGAKAACIAGAVGPLGLRPGEISMEEVRAVFAEQMAALAEGALGVGVDLLLVETMISMAEAVEAYHAARDVAPGLRVVVMMTVDEAGICLDGMPGELAAARLTELGVDAVGCNCSFGPATVLRTMERMRAATHLPLAAMPNAGLPRTVAGRTAYAVSPQEMAEFARKAVEAGVNLIGGCCGTTPEHIRAMRPAILAPWIIERPSE